MLRGCDAHSLMDSYSLRRSTPIMLLDAGQLVSADMSSTRLSITASMPGEFEFPADSAHRPWLSTKALRTGYR